MKQSDFLEILVKLKSKPGLMRKVKIFAAVGIVGLLATGALVIWAGVSAINYVASSAHQAVESPVTQGHVENLKTEINGLPKFQAISCWSKAQTLLAVHPWLERPALDNLANLKVACFEHMPIPCEGAQCANLRESIGAGKELTI
jgi:hypothetical protein